MNVLIIACKTNGIISLINGSMILLLTSWCCQALCNKCHCRACSKKINWFFMYSYTRTGTRICSGLKLLITSFSSCQKNHLHTHKSQKFFLPLLLSFSSKIQMLLPLSSINMKELWNRCQKKQNYISLFYRVSCTLSPIH